MLRCGEDGDVDLHAVSRGAVAVSPARLSIAVSVLAGCEVALDEADLSTLLGVPAGRWLPIQLAGEPERIRRLALEGLLVTDDDDPRLVELRRRDEQLTATGWSLHSSLYHSLARRHDVDLGLGVDLDETRIAADAAAMAGWVSRGGPPPPGFHRRDDAVAIHDLPLSEPDGSLFRLLHRRRTSRGFLPGGSLTVEQLSTILRAVFGCHGRARYGNGLEAFKKTSPSGGALHPIEVYPVVRRVDGLDPGIYHYSAERHALELLEPLPEPGAASFLRAVTCGQGAFGQASVAFLLAVRFRRNFWKYWGQKEQYSVLLLDAGHLSQTLYLVAAELGLAALVTAVINHDDVDGRLGLERFSEGVLAVCACGVTGPSDLDTTFVPYDPATARQQVSSTSGRPPV